MIGEALSMRTRAQMLLMLLFVLGLTAYPSAALAAAATSGPTTPARQIPTIAPRQVPMIVTMRLGISAGDTIQSVQLGTDRRTLERTIPDLFSNATALGVRIDAVSVGRGFWSEDGEVDHENDLDLVVTGLRENILALGATLGQQWGQSTVLAWEMTVTGDMATATLPLTGGTAGLDDTVFEALAKELTDGGHIKYAGPESLVFVAHTGDDSDDQFKARMARAKGILDTAGVRTGSLTFAQAEMVAISRDEYQQFIDGAVRGKTG
jgi:hypothetical protein